MRRESRLGKVGLKYRFAGRICSARDVEKAKPAPDVYLLAASKVGVDVADCIVVDDRISGVRAGVASGAATVGLVGLTSILRENNAHYVAENHADLLTLFSEWLP